MSNVLPLSDWADRGFQLIDQIIEMTLKGNIRSKEQVYQMLVQGVEPGTGEIFERCLSDRLTATQQDIAQQTDEFKVAKANRRLRALQTIQGEWERAQEQHQTSAAIAQAVEQIRTAEPRDRVRVFLHIIDPNQAQPLNLSQLKTLGTALQQAAGEVSDSELVQIGQGILQGLESWQRLEDHLVSWIYDQGRGQLGFMGVPGQQGPWSLWGKQVNRPLLQGAFHTLALQQPLTEWTAQQPAEISEWVELILVFRYLQQGLVAWFEKLIYDTKVGGKLAISTFLTFGVITSQFASGFYQKGSLGTAADLGNAMFQVTLQILRLFAQRDYFPLYGGIFASFTGQYLRDALEYLDEPLRRSEGTQAKARILTLLGYSSRAQGQERRALEFHQQALEIAQEAGDRACEIANFNHLSRIYIAQKNYPEAIRQGQRALILSRQNGDRVGEANALANVGYSEVLQAQQLEQLDPDVYDTAIHFLEQGLNLAEQLGDRQSQALCLSSLGIARLVLDQPAVALTHLDQGWQAAQIAGDLYLQGLNLAYLAEAYYRLEQWEPALYTGCLGMYLLEQISATLWRQPAGLLTILQGQLGAGFQKQLEQLRSRLIALIGVDGYDHIPHLLSQYRSSQE